MLNYRSLTTIVMIITVIITYCDDVERIPADLANLHNNNNREADGNIDTSTPTHNNTGTIRGVAVGSNGLIISIVYNGIDWIIDRICTIIEPNEITSSIISISRCLTEASIYTVSYKNDLWIAAGNDETLLTSENGIDWIKRELPKIDNPYNLPYGIYDVTYGDGKWVAVGSFGNILKSIDGMKWDYVSSGYDKTLYSVIYKNGLWVSVGSAGAILTSSDGINWELQSLGNIDKLYGIYYDNGLWTAIGYECILTSSDAKEWSVTKLPDLTLNDIYYENGLWTIVGSDLKESIEYEEQGIILGSNRGINWDFRNYKKTYGLKTIYYKNGLWIAAGNSGSLHTSIDGINWNKQEFLEDSDFINDIAIHQ